MDSICAMSENWRTLWPRREKCSSTSFSRRENKRRISAIATFFVTLIALSSLFQSSHASSDGCDWTGRLVPTQTNILLFRIDYSKVKHLRTYWIRPEVLFETGRHSCGLGPRPGFFFLLLLEQVSCRPFLPFWWITRSYFTCVLCGGGWNFRGVYPPFWCFFFTCQISPPSDFFFFFNLQRGASSSSSSSKSRVQQVVRVYVT